MFATVLEEEIDDGRGDGDSKECADRGDIGHQPSTLIAKFEACSGYSGKSTARSSVLLVPSHRGTVDANSVLRANISAAENKNTGDDGEDGENPSKPDNLQDCGAIAGSLRIVLKAIKQQMIDGVPIFPAEASTKPRRTSREGTRHHRNSGRCARPV